METNTTPSTEPKKEETLKDKIPLPVNLYVGKATVDLFSGPMSKDYISGNPNLPEKEKQKNRRITYMLLAVVILLIIGLVLFVK
jgi:hypothetical protein